MKIAAISDIHIKQRDEASNFQRSDEELLSLLTTLEREYEKIYLLGDIFECQQGLAYPIKQTQIRELEKAVQSYPRSMAFLDQQHEKFHYLSGNHDAIMHVADISELPPVLHRIYKGREASITTDKGKIYLQHGEEGIYDTWFRWVWWALPWIAGLWERVKGNPLPSQLKKTPVTEKRFLELCKTKEDAMVGVYGHNHFPDTYTVNINNRKCTYINSGYVDTKHIFVAVVDVDTLLCEVKEYRYEDLKE